MSYRIIKRDNAYIIQIKKHRSILGFFKSYSWVSLKYGYPFGDITYVTLDMAKAKLKDIKNNHPIKVVYEEKWICFNCVKTTKQNTVEADEVHIEYCSECGELVECLARVKE